MAHLSVLITEKIPNSLKGEITRWMLEVKTGVFIGTLSKLVRDLLWQKITHNIENGGAMFIEPAANEQKFQTKTCGTFSRYIRDMEGITLIAKEIQKVSSKEGNGKKNLSTFDPLTYYATRKDIKPSNTAMISWSVPPNLPQGLIFRTFVARMTNQSEPKIKYHASGNSHYYEYPPSRIWMNSEIEELMHLAHILLPLFQETEKNTPTIENAKMGVFDLEETDFLPKQQQGYIVILGLCTIYISPETQCPTLVFKQVLNLTRQRTLSGTMLHLLWKDFFSCNSFISYQFNSKWLHLDLLAREIGSKLPSEFSYIDLALYLPTLKSVYTNFDRKCPNSLQILNESNYSQFYQAFKGDSHSQINKNIFPLCRFNNHKIWLGLYHILKNRHQWPLVSWLTDSKSSDK